MNTNTIIAGVPVPVELIDCTTGAYDSADTVEAPEYSEVVEVDYATALRILEGDEPDAKPDVYAHPEDFHTGCNCDARVDCGCQEIIINPSETGCTGCRVSSLDDVVRAATVGALL